jgi:hypothetical protein
MRTRITAIGYVLALCLFILFSSSPCEADTDELDREIKLADKVSEQVEKHWDRVTDPVRVARVTMILSRLTPYTERDLPFEVRLAEEERPNAFALPAGRIYMTTGMLEFCRSDDEVASILAHELIHTDRKHGIIQSSRNQRLTIGALAVIIATGGAGAAPILANLAQVAIMNSYSMDLEREADTMGLDILLQSGYEPAGAVTVMERLQEEEMKRPYVDPGIYADHPKTRDRIRSLESIIREKGWPLERKKALHLLRIQTKEEKGFLFLSIDGKPVWRAPKVEGADELIEKAATSLDKNLQMETLPYDVSIQEIRGEKTLRVGLGVIVSEKDLLPGMPSLEEFRENILSSLNRARMIHPVADYNG